MSESTSIYMASGIMVLLTTIAQFNGHIDAVAFYQIVGSIVGTLVLSKMLASFK